MNQTNLMSLSEALGTQIIWNADGQCCLEFEGDIEITLALHEEVISLRSLLGEGAEQNLRNALASQYRNPTPGFSLALDDSSNQLFLMTVIELENEEIMPEVVFQLLNLTQELKIQTNQVYSQSKDASETDSPPNSPGVMLA
jgi:hypothetical protein